MFNQNLALNPQMSNSRLNNQDQLLSNSYQIPIEIDITIGYSAS